MVRNSHEAMLCLDLIVFDSFDRMGVTLFSPLVPPFATEPSVSHCTKPDW